MPTTSFPLLLGSDCLWLDPAFMIHATKRRLIDTSLGVFHSSSQEALQLLEMLRHGVSLSNLQAKACEQNITAPELCLFLGFLNDCGALRRKRNLKHYREAWWTNFVSIMHGLRYDPITWRRNLGFAALSCAAIRACSTLILATVLLDLFLIKIERWNSISIVVHSSIGLIVFVLSIVVHEYAHARAIAHWGNSVVVVQRRLHIGLLHARLSKSVEIVSALIGPLSGGAFLLINALLFYLAHQPILTLIALCMSALHVGSLSPWYGDGRSLWRACRQGKELA